MSEITSIPGKAVLDRKVLTKMLAYIKPTKLNENSTLYHIGQERAKEDMLDIMALALGQEFSRSNVDRLIMELRRG